MNSFDINIQQGTTFNLTFIASDCSGNLFNFSGYSARGKVKYAYGYTGVMLDLQPQIDPSLISGIITISIPQEMTSGLPVTKGVFDVEAFNSGDYCFKIAGGYANIFPEVSFF